MAAASVHGLQKGGPEAEPTPYLKAASGARHLGVYVRLNVSLFPWRALSDKSPPFCTEGWAEEASL